jgi:hypothetical protein
MQIGAENRNKTIAAIVLMALAVGLIVVRLLPGSGGSAPVAAAPSAKASAVKVAPPAQRTASGGKRVPAERSLDPTLRFDWLKASEDNPYQGTGRNIFRAEAEIPQPNGNGTTDTHGKNEPPPTPPPPPPPPPINLKFFGFASKPGEPKKVFLSQGEDVFIAAEGDIIDRRYKILHIAPMSVEVEDVLNNNRQNIPLTQG